MTAPPLRIGINAQLVTFSASYRNAGVSRFTEQLIHALQLRDRTNRYSVFVNDTAQKGGFAGSGNFAFQPSRLPTSKPLVRILWEQAFLPGIARSLGLDVLHAPVNVVPLAAPCRLALTIHDLTFLVYPDRFRSERRRYLAAMTRISARRADCIMTDSANTKADVSRLLKVSPEKIRVVYPGLDENFRPPEAAEVEDFRRRKGLPERFILFLGTIEPRKNVDQLIDAYGRLLRQGLKDCDLVIAGGRGWMAEDVFEAAEQEHLRGRVHFPGYVEQAEQALWYGAADVFVYPSLYEGFGLPVLEAMACGTPVVTSTASSLPEVVGTAGTTVDPRQPEQLAAAIAEVLESPEKQERMREAGLRQAAKFSWQEAADRALSAYRQAADLR